jgi:hypothetical protein
MFNFLNLKLSHSQCRYQGPDLLLSLAQYNEEYYVVSRTKLTTRSIALQTEKVHHPKTLIGPNKMSIVLLPILYHVTQQSNT